MSVARMKYINVYGPEQSLVPTLGQLARCGCFAPEEGEAIHSAIRYGTNRYEPLLTKAKGLLKDLGHNSLAADYIGPVDRYKQAEVADFLERFAAEVAERSKRRTDIQTELELYEKTDGLLAHMADVDVNMDEIFKVDYLHVRIGRLPKNSYVRLAYYADKGFNFTSYFNFTVYDYDGEYYWGLYFAPDEAAKEIDDIFKSLYFERIWIPEFVHGTPQEALDAVRKRETQLKEELASITTPAGIVSEEELREIQDMTAWLSYRNQLYGMKKYALVYDHVFYISGFVPVDDMAKLQEAMAACSEVKIQEASGKQRVPASPPTKLKNGFWSRPYEMYTKMYGLPSYSDIDPTFIVSVLYSILYGLMFADVGQGLVLGLFGYFIMYKKMGMAIGNILARASVFCVLFGLIFGSVFGNEHLLDPMFHALGFAEKPIDVLDSSSVTAILLVSLGIGIFVVLMAIILGTITKFRRGDIGEAVASPNGIAGMIFYIGVIFFALDLLVLKTGVSGSMAYILPALIIPVAVMYLQEPIAHVIDHRNLHVGNPGNILLSGFFELFVTMLEYLSNTVSFLRVGGFILVHAGMMTVVETLAHMSGGVGSIVVMVIGNAFVIALEGLLVGIQALRLNYFELFSRFYAADGKPFEPLQIQSDTTEL